MKTNTIMNGDCIQHLKELPENSIGAIITDPPYGLNFMGKKWDYDVPSVEIWKECFRVLKHGGYLLSFAGTRTYHRMVVNVEDAGFEIRDMISWLYGSGFPKSLNIGKQIDKLQGNEREVISKERSGKTSKGFNDYQYRIDKDIYSTSGEYNNTKGSSEWEGWGTALKPACEPIVVARKPLSEKNVALNVLKWGTGGINIAESRIGTEPIKCMNDIRSLQKWKEQDGRNHKELINPEPTYNQGRFPANIILDEEAGKMLDEQSGVSKSGKQGKRTSDGFNDNIYGKGMGIKAGEDNGEYGDKGGASRFFYCAKASKSERNLGCEEPNNHPTVKPISLLEYLIKLVTKEGAIVLDPFLGSGTTAVACIKLNRLWIGIEKEPEYIEIAKARIKPFLEQSRFVNQQEKEQ